MRGSRSITSPAVTAAVDTLLQRGASIEDLAYRWGLSRETLYIAKRRGRASRRTLRLIARALRRPVATLLPRGVNRCPRCGHIEVPPSPPAAKAPAEDHR